MNNNTTINNVTVNAANNKEDKDMMNLTCTVEELKGMKYDVLRTAAKCFKIKGYSRMKKVELIEALVPFCKETENEVSEVESKATVGYTLNPLDDPEIEAMDVSDEALLQPIVNETVNVVENKEETTMNNNLIKRIAHDIIFQTIPNKNGKLIFDKDKDGKLVLIKGTALFYRPDKKDNPATEYMVLGKRLWGVISKAISEVEGEDKKTFDYIQETIDKFVELDLITKISEERTFVKLTPSDMSQDEKDQLNGLWRTNDIKTEKLEDGRIKAIAVTDNGKAVLNQLYPCYSYGATVDQMNRIYTLSK